MAPLKLRLYISGSSPSAPLHKEQAEAVCALLDDCVLEVVDLTDDAAKAEADKVLGLPALLRLDPPPRRRVVGDLSDASEIATYLSREPH